MNIFLGVLIRVEQVAQTTPTMKTESLQIDSTRENAPNGAI